MEEYKRFERFDPCSHAGNKRLINSFINKVGKNKKLSTLFQEIKESSLLIMNDEEKGSFGGALLARKNVYSLEKRIRENMPKSTLQERETWMCTVYLPLENENIFSDFEDFSKKFYLELYRKLSEFGLRAGVDYLSIILLPGEYLCTEVLGFWPYVIEVRPNESEDGLFHGILSLLKSRPKPNPKNWETYLSEYNRLAA